MIGNLATSCRPDYDLVEPVEVRAAAGGDPLFLALVATKAFQRLKSIRFLGGIDYVLVRSPNGFKGNVRYTRYQHSLGVARLALFYCNAIAPPLKDRRLVFAAALLHDIGHAPLSHSLEPIFKEVFGVTHHQATEDIIAGRVPLGVDVYKILRKYGIDVERLIATIAGREAGFHGFFSGPINFDTIEGIVRAQAYTRPKPNTLSPDAITQAALRRSGDRDQSAVDQFWLYKEQVYRHVINSRAGVLADIACQNFMRRHLNKMSLEDYFVTEPQVFRKLPGLRNLLTNRLFEIQMMRLMDGPISYTARHFYIDSNSDFFARNDTGRYRQSRERCTLMPHHLHAAEPVGLTQDLFNDPSY